MKKAKPLESRTFKFKRPALRFFCPLCRSERALTQHSKLSTFNYLQITLISLILMLALLGIFEEKVFFIPLVVWGLYEGAFKYFFRQQIPCPHCGFDATWYKRNVPKAKKIVQKFWEDKAKDSSETLPELPVEDVKEEHSMAPSSELTSP